MTTFIKQVFKNITNLLKPYQVTAHEPIADDNTKDNRITGSHRAWNIGDSYDWMRQYPNYCVVTVYSRRGAIICSRVRTDRGVRVNLYV